MSLRYSIYKVQTSFSFQAHLSPSVNCYILAHLVELVKNFFQVFRSFLVVPLCSRLSLFITQLFKFITSHSICQELFCSFSNLFDVVPRVFRTQLDYYTSLAFICQELFSHSCKFRFVLALFYCPRGQLAYISTSIPICQALFNIIQAFLLLVFTCGQVSFPLRTFLNFCWINGCLSLSMHPLRQCCSLLSVPNPQGLPFRTAFRFP